MRSHTSQLFAGSARRFSPFLLALQRVCEQHLLHYRRMLVRVLAPGSKMSVCLAASARASPRFRLTAPAPPWTHRLHRESESSWSHRRFQWRCVHRLMVAR